MSSDGSRVPEPVLLPPPQPQAANHPGSPPPAGSFSSCGWVAAVADLWPRLAKVALLDSEEKA
jgi:hypothetical protein